MINSVCKWCLCAIVFVVFDFENISNLKSEEKSRKEFRRSRKNCYVCFCVVLSKTSMCRRDYPTNYSSFGSIELSYSISHVFQSIDLSNDRTYILCVKQTNKEKINGAAMEIAAPGCKYINLVIDVIFHYFLAFLSC